MDAFYSFEELSKLGLKSIGKNVLISRKSSIYSPHVISIGNNVRIDDFCILSGGVGIDLGNYIHIAAYSAIFGAGLVKMDDYSGLSSRVTVYSVSDDYSGRSMTNPMISDEYKPYLSKGPVTIGKHVVVGTNTTILPNVVLENGCAIGAYSLVSRKCKELWIYSGVPAKKLMPRQQDILSLEKQMMQDIVCNTL